jgi:hypothetical protein
MPSSTQYLIFGRINNEIEIIPYISFIKLVINGDEF